MNGGGVTHEIARKADERGMFWRVSTARVEADCYYSLFPDLQRISAVVEGNGVRLTNTETKEASLIGPSDIAVLSGAVLYQGELQNGGFRHLNLVFDPRRTTGVMKYLKSGTTALPAGAVHLVYCCAGEVSGSDGILAGPGEVLLVIESSTIRLNDGARAVHICVGPSP